MTNKKILSHSLALQDAIKFFGFAKGQVSKQVPKGTPTPPGLDIFTPYTPSNRALLVGEGAMLDRDIHEIVTLSVAGPNKSRADVLTGQQSVASQSNNIWWNFPLVAYSSTETAVEMLELASTQDEPLPVVLLSELIAESKDDARVQLVVQGILNRTSGPAGPAYFDRAERLIPHADRALLVFAPSSSPDTGVGLWTNAPSMKRQQNTTSAGNSASAGAPSMDVVG